MNALRTLGSIEEVVELLENQYHLNEVGGELKALSSSSKHPIADQLFNSRQYYLQGPELFYEFAFRLPNSHEELFQICSK